MNHMDDGDQRTQATEAQVVIRSSATMYALFGGIFGVPLLGSFFVTVFKERDFWLPTVLSLLVLAGFLSWLATARLVLTTDAIHYRSLLVTKDVALSDIVKAEFATGLRPNKPFQRLVITARNSQGEEDLTLNLGLFAPHDIRGWMNELNGRLL